MVWYGMVSNHNGCLELRAHERRATSYDYGVSDLKPRNLGVSDLRISECRNIVSLPDMLETKHGKCTGKLNKKVWYGMVSKHNGCLEFRAHERRATSYDYRISDFGYQNLVSRLSASLTSDGQTSTAASQSQNIPSRATSDMQRATCDKRRVPSEGGRRKRR